jgi:hypothetical protein
MKEGRKKDRKERIGIVRFWKSVAFFCQCVETRKKWKRDHLVGGAVSGGENGCIF